MIQYLKELLKRRDLIIYLVLSDMKAEYHNTILGYFWWILDPLLMGIIYYFLRVIILNLEGDYIGAFLVIGLVTWKWISAAINFSSSSISRNAGIITQVYLPKMIFPFGTTLTQGINFTFGLAVISLFLIFYNLIPGIEIIWLPFVMLIQFIFLLALSMILAYYATFVRDIQNVLSHVLRFWFYSSPVIWEASRLPEKYLVLVDINPAATFLKSYRNVLMYQTPPDINKLLIIGFISLAVIIYMTYFYYLNEHKLIKAL